MILLGRNLLALARGEKNEAEEVCAHRLVNAPEQKESRAYLLTLRANII